MIVFAVCDGQGLSGVDSKQDFGLRFILLDNTCIDPVDGLQANLSNKKIKVVCN